MLPTCPCFGNSWAVAGVLYAWRLSPAYQSVVRMAVVPLCAARTPEALWETMKTKKQAGIAA